MKKLIVVVLSVLAGLAAPVRAGMYYSNDVSASSGTQRIAGVVKVADPASPYVPTITLNGVGGAAAFGNVTASSVTARDGAIIGASTFTAAGALTMASAANISLGNASAFVIKDTGGTERTMVTMGGTSDLLLNTHGSFNTKINPNGGNITTGSGNVGVGVASPNNVLDANGCIAAKRGGNPAACAADTSVQATSGFFDTNYGFRCSGVGCDVRSTASDGLTLTATAAGKPIILTPGSGGGVGIGTASPCSTCTLHVAGGASVTGAFAVASATFTVATTGIVSAPSQPAIRAYLNASVTIPNGGPTPIYFGGETWKRNLNHSVSVSSDTFTVATGGGGDYRVHACLFANSLTVGGYSLNVWVNGAQKNRMDFDIAASAAGFTFCTEDEQVLAAGDYVQLMMTAPGSTGLFGNANGQHGIFIMEKVR